MTATDPSPRRPTMIQVARLAGVSHQTVSRYLRFNGGLKEETVERIDAAVKELDYRPNLIARSMRTRRTGLLSILTPSEMNTFTPHHIAGATAEAHRSGYQVEVTSVEGGPNARAQRMLELADSGMFEGILSLAFIAQESLDRLHSDGAAVVVSGNYDDKLRGIGELADGAPIERIVERLAELGHRRFLHVAGPDNYPSADGRKAAYLRAIARMGLSSYGVFAGDWSGESGIAAIASLPDDSGVTAVICANDVVAAGVIRGAIDRGWTVPGTISVSGWDNNPLGAFLPPTLTSVEADYVMLGRRSMRRLIAAAQGRSVDDRLESAELNTIHWRESTGPAPVA
jgi:DNA-binding LacI/PurR family transcriptional regulator